MPNNVTQPHKKTMQTIPFKVTSHDPATRSFVFTASDASIDRQGDVVEQSSWNFDNYKKNPVVLWAHDYSTYPIARTLSIGVENGIMKFQPSFATADEYQEADTIYKLILGGYINACSVGFIPSEVVPAKDGSSYILKDCELLEVSIVAVPANANAVRLAADEGVISVSEKELLISHYKKALETLETKSHNLPEMTVEKSGAKHSAATMAALKAAMEHCDSASVVIKTIMSDGNDDSNTTEGGRGEGNSEGKAQPEHSSTNKAIDGEQPIEDANDEKSGANLEDEDPDITVEEQQAYEAAFAAELSKLQTGRVE